MIQHGRNFARNRRICLRNALTMLDSYGEEPVPLGLVTLAAAIGARVSAVQLLDVEFFGGQHAMRAKSRRRGRQIARTGCVAAPFADTVPEKAKCPKC